MACAGGEPQGASAANPTAANSPAQPPAKSSPASTTAATPWLLLVTLDTTRADALTPEVAPEFTALKRRGLEFTQAYATAPSTLPSHVSMMSGLYPAGHGIHENGRRVGAQVPWLAAELDQLGYRTAAFVSGYPLSSAFGLARGFGVYDDALVDGLERKAADTTARALAFLDQASTAPLFLWVHYYDAHEPYAPPAPWAGRFGGDPYLGEIAAMDQAMGRLVERFEQVAGDRGAKILILADHGEGRGDHGERFHGNLLYQGVMHVPLVLVEAGTGAGSTGRREEPVSARQVRATFLQWATGKDQLGSLMAPAASASPVLAEAMQPFLNYRWQPQVMAVAGPLKVIRAGRTEIYDLLADPAEQNDLGPTLEPSRELLQALADYPLPTAGAPSSPPPSDEEARKLASLGYTASLGPPPAVPANAPRPVDMVGLFPALDDASHAFVAGDYARSVPLLTQILARDPGNLMAAIRLAVCQSFLGQDEAAQSSFARARRIDPDSLELRHYLALHHLRFGRVDAAAPLLEQLVAAQPERFTVLHGLAQVARSRGQLQSAAVWLERARAVAEPTRLGALDAELGELLMARGSTEAAIEAFERAQATQGPQFRHHLELGVLYLAARRVDDARAALDRVPADHPQHSLWLFKRAQVSVLLGETDRAARVRAAYAAADPELRAVLAQERLFAEFLQP